MPIGTQLKRNLKKSNASQLKYHKFQRNLGNFQRNHRETEYQQVQRNMELILQK